MIPATSHRADLPDEGTPGAPNQVELLPFYHDEFAFSNPDVFDYDRSPQEGPHLGFAAGLHSCMGQPLARQEAETILTAVSRQCSSIELAEEPVYHSIQHAPQWRTLDLHLTFH
ncbi:MULTISPECIES: cytochrome P450 [Nocardiaceae]|uniref:Cytochrome P450 n=1 Tax=Rhodococcoides corynebacterioides TaxID=53972 RepID=A0ABS2KZI9_9NOCA|nr:MULTISPECIES: cytochrome P450 [Rhodococcus]MBM7417353.1 cytochrome P450 [Rhodococcus corynebacterioides]MBP1115606.1 cytochrome P450 [Rhodococcus sp. PvP016]